MTKKWHIYFIMWVSWAGKWTLINNLKKQDLNLHIPLSYKSRPPREFEENGKDAYFISREEFEKGIENHEFLEYAVVHNMHYYGTKYKDVLDEWIYKWKVVVKEIDILGLKRLIKEKPELRSHYTTIFLNIPVEVLKQRIKKRWETITKQELQEREKSAIMEEQQARLYCDYMLDATQPEDKVLKEVLDIIK